MPDTHNVRKGLEIVFADGTPRTVYPLTLKALRKFVKVIDKMSELEDAQNMSDEDIDHMTDAAAVILEKIDPALSADRDRLEEAIDLPIFQKIMGVAMGNASPEE